MRIRPITAFALFLCLLTSLCFPVLAQDAPAPSIEETLIDSCTYGDTVSLDYTFITYEALKNIYAQLITDGRLPWYVSGAFQYDYLENSNQVLSFSPIYLYEGEIDQTLYEQQIAEVLALCVCEGMTQWQIALSIHDYLIANIAYDETLEKNTGYDGLVNSSTICAGYATLYQDLLQRAGIDCKYVTSEEMNHGWNIVCIDEKWYHVDLTWDDPTPNSQGQVLHNYFLLTDEEISSGEKPHHSWDVTTVCDDARFADAFWRNVNSQICFESSSVCYLIRTDDFQNTVYRRNDTSGKETRLYAEQKNYTNIGYGDYKYYHQGLTLQNGRLYFNTLDKIISINTDGTNAKTEYTYDTKANQRYLQGSHISGDVAYISAADHDGNPTDISVPLDLQLPHTHQYTLTEVPADCINGGYTLSVCNCGLEAQSDLQQATGHNYQITRRQDPTLFKVGQTIWECENCQDTYTEELARLTFTDLLKDYGSYFISAIAVMIVLLSQNAKARKRRKTKV